MKILYSIGPYPSRRVGDYIVIVDPVGFPKKCPYNCIYCPIGETIIKTNQPNALINYNTILRDFENIIDKIGCHPKAILLYGSGDPWLNPWLPLIVNGIRKILAEKECRSELWAVTTGFLLNRPWALNVLENIDKIYLKLDTISGEEYTFINDPVEGLSPWKLKEILNDLKKKSLLRNIVLDITLIEYNGENNYRSHLIDEIFAYANMVRIENIIIKTINRPPRTKGVKPVSTKVLRKVGEKAIEEGLNPLIVTNEVIYQNYPRKINVGVEEIYNYLLRRPMSIIELSRSFSQPIHTVVSKLLVLEKNRLVDKIPWRNKIFYKSLYVRTL